MPVSPVRRRQRPARTAAVLCLGAIALLAPASAAHASISDAAVVDGPSASILGLDGVAMAPDGTGGMVFRKRVGGRSHVFVSRFSGGRWLAPRQVDAGQAFDSTTPAIGAGNGGRLVVVWVQAFGADVQDRLYSASLDPGAQAFQAPIPIDLDVRDGTDVDPSISMNAGGTAYLAYRVVLDRSDPSLPPGTVNADVRVQRYSGAFWSAFGNPVDRNVSQPMATPTALDRPRVATDVNGNAIVAWREPDDDLVPRVYARRLFGLSQGFVKQVSPSKVGTAPLRGGVDQFALAGSPFGEGAIAWRQQVASRDPYTRPRAFVSLIPNTLTDKAADFLAPLAIDLGGADGPAGALGPVSIAVSDDGSWVSGLGLDTSSSAVLGGETAVSGAGRLDDGGSAAPGLPVVTRSNEGAIAAAWDVDGGVGIRELRSDGTPADQVVSSPAGGATSALQLGGSGLGDAAIGFVQGTGDATQLVGASVDAPPESFDVATPADWTKAKKIALDWDAAPHAIGGVSYTLQLDGEDLVEKLARTGYDATAEQVDDGRHVVTVVATDAGGQETTSADATLLVDRAAPKATVKVSRKLHRVTVTVSDGAKGESSGVDLAATKASFGDGKRASGKRTLRRSYGRAGRFTVKLTLADKAGNKRTITKRVRV